MKVVLEQPLSGAKTYDVGEEIEVSELEAVRMIEKGIAKCKTKKDHETFVSKIEKIKKDKEDRQAAAKAMLEKERIESELNGLYGEVVIKEAELSGVVLTDTEIVEMVEELKKRNHKGRRK